MEPKADRGVVGNQTVSIPHLSSIELNHLRNQLIEMSEPGAQTANALKMFAIDSDNFMELAMLWKGAAKGTPAKARPTARGWSSKKDLASAVQNFNLISKYAHAHAALQNCSARLETELQRLQSKYSVTRTKYFVNDNDEQVSYINEAFNLALSRQEHEHFEGLQDAVDAQRAKSEECARARATMERLLPKESRYWATKAAPKKAAAPTIAPTIAKKQKASSLMAALLGPPRSAPSVPFSWPVEKGVYGRVPLPGMDVEAGTHAK